MMLLSEPARDRPVRSVAATAASHASGSTLRLFLLVYATGIVITTFLSNDATAILLIATSAFDVALGLPSFFAVLATTVGVYALTRRSPVALAS